MFASRMNKIIYFQIMFQISDYVNDQNIIEYLISADQFLSDNKSIENNDCFVIGYITATAVDTPKELEQQMAALTNFFELVQAGVVLESHKVQILTESMYNPNCYLPSLIEKVLMSPDQNLEEEKVSESVLIAKIGLKSLLESVETQLLALAYDETDPIAFAPIDILVWGLLTKHHQKADPQHALKLIKQIREAEFASLCNHNQKLRIYINFFKDLNTDPSLLLEKAVMDPTLGSEPLTALKLTEEQKQKLSEEIASQYQLQEQLDLEKARREKDMKENETLECSVCFEKLIDKIVGFTNLDNCKHLFHAACLSSYVNQQLKDRKVPINCPSCLVEMNYNDFAQFFSEEQLDELDKILFKQFIDNRMNGFSWCPTADCSYVFELKKKDLAPESGWSGRFTCPTCENEYCLRCKTNYHEGLSCEEWQRANKRENLVLAFQQFQYKKCPHCGYWVEKVEGCNHLACACGNSFCYGCGSTYDACKCDFLEIEEEEGKVLPESYYEGAIREDGKKSQMERYKTKASRGTAKRRKKKN